MNGSYWLTRFVFLRALGLIYLIAFLVAFNQFVPLLGSNGIFPVGDFLQEVARYQGAGFKSFWTVPSLLWFHHSDFFIQVVAGIGAGLSFVVLLGFANSLILFVLWALYLSFVNTGQLFYGYGWETMLLETGFLAMFLPPLLNPTPFPIQVPPSPIVMWLIRWELFRVMFGAGLIKLRGDSCWRDLTCLSYHFETQPVPNPVSWYFHQLPSFFLKGGVLFNHLAELIAPFLLFGPRRVRQLGAGIIVIFQLILIVSGNLSWLNYLTLILCIPAFEDEALGFLFSKKRRDRIGIFSSESKTSPLRRGVNYALAGLVALLSIQPILNLVSPGQLMNYSFNPLHMVNTYGAFGSITEVRREIILEGTDDERISEQTPWRAYEFKCKPGDPARRPCLMSPYHFRLDWQMWFAAMGNYRQSPWLLSLIEKLLQGNKAISGLMAPNPFSDKAPRFIRAELYEYHFTKVGDPTQDWWRRERLGPYLPPLMLREGRLSAVSGLPENLKKLNHW